MTTGVYPPSDQQAIRVLLQRSRTTGLLTGNPWVGLASGAAGKIADAGVTYVKALQARRKGKLIMDVAMLFDPHGSAELTSKESASRCQSAPEIRVMPVSREASKLNS